MEHRYRAVVIDPGSLLTKAGFAGECAPRTVFPTLVRQQRELDEGGGAAAAGGRGDPRTKGVFYVGHEAQARRGTDGMVASYPVGMGCVSNWEAMEKLLYHTIHNDLRVSPEEHPFLITEFCRTQRSLREKMGQLMFEQLGVPALHIAVKPVLSLYAFGSTTGVVLDSGDDITNVVPLYEGHPLYMGVLTLPRIDGRSLAEYLGTLLGDRYSVMRNASMDVLRDIKENFCYIAQDPKQNSTLEEQSYKLPDGQVITLKDERFRAPEALFEPAPLQSVAQGIHQLTNSSIRTCSFDADTQRELYSNIVLSGGTTMFPGLADRLHKELTALAPPNTRVRIIAPPERRHAVWIGGSILSSLSSFSQMWVSREEYDESGPSAMNGQYLFTGLSECFREKKTWNNNRA